MAMIPDTLGTDLGRRYIISGVTAGTFSLWFKVRQSLAYSMLIWLCLMQSAWSSWIESDPIPCSKKCPSNTKTPDPLHTFEGLSMRLLSNVLCCLWSLHQSCVLNVHLRHPCTVKQEMFGIFFDRLGILPPYHKSISTPSSTTIFSFGLQYASNFFTDKLA